MLKTLGGTESKIRPSEGGVRIGGSRAGCGESKLDNERRVDSDEVGDDEVGTKVQKSSKSKKTESGFLTLGARKAFTKLRQAFIIAPILQHFELKCYIWVKTDASGYAISGVLSQLISDDLGRWHPIAFFSRKIIPAETRYETHNSELLAIVKVFKT